MASGTKDRKVAIITGGSKGIGLAIAHCLAEDGYDLILNYNSDVSAAENAKSAIEAQHKRYIELISGF